MARSRSRVLALASCLLLAASAVLATEENDFSLYPGDAQGCLRDASERSKCDGDTVAEHNKCLCSNGGSFVTNAARCIGQEAPATLRTVWTTMSTSCSDSNTPLAVTEDDFISIGQRESGSTSTRTVSSTAGPSSTATGSPTSTPDAQEEETEDKTDGGLSVAAKAGIGIGAAAGAAVLGGILAMAWNSRRSRRAHDEARQSMLPDGRGSPGAAEAGIGGYHGAAGQADWGAGEKNQKGRPASNMTGFVTMSDATADGRGSWMTGSPPPHLQQFGSWGHHPDQPWPVSPPPPGAPGVGAGAGAGASGVYELSSAEAATRMPPPHHAVEMPATPGPGNASQYPGGGWAR